MAGLIRFAMLFNSPNTTSNIVEMTGHVSQTGIDTPTDTQVDDVLDILLAWWNTGTGGGPSLKAQCSSKTILQTVEGQVIQPTPKAPVRSKTSGVAGTGSASMLPIQCAAVLSLRTNLAGRSYRGRMYVPGLPTDFIGSDGSIASAKQTALANSAEGLRIALDAVHAGSCEMVVYSRLLDHKERVVQMRVGNQVDVQRRRRLPETSYVIGA